MKGLGIFTRNIGILAVLDPSKVAIARSPYESIDGRLKPRLRFAEILHSLWRDS